MRVDICDKMINFRNWKQRRSCLRLVRKIWKAKWKVCCVAITASVLVFLRHERSSISLSFRRCVVSVEWYS